MSKPVEPDDPMELVGVEVPGCDSEEVLDDVVQEYLLMGWGAQQILMLFASPYYAFTHGIYRQLGPTRVRRRVLELFEQWNQGWIKGGKSDAAGL